MHEPSVYRVRRHTDEWRLDFNDDTIAVFDTAEHAADHARRIAATLARTLHREVRLIVHALDDSVQTDQMFPGR